MSTFARERVLDPFLGRQLPVVALVSYLIALAAWSGIVLRWLPMPGGSMDMSMSDPGVPEAMALSSGFTGAGLYLLMWGTMMVAMMYPASVPMFSLYHRTLDGTTRTGRAARLGAFMGTYVLIWTSVGLIPLVVNTVVPLATVVNAYGGVLLGGSLLLLSGYQLSSYKYRCLRYCRSPFGFLMSHHQPGIRGAIRMSLNYSAFCVGCCWALFAFMVVVGSMNILWMAVITVVLSLERVVSWGGELAYGIGILAGIAGSAIIVLTIV